MGTGERVIVPKGGLRFAYADPPYLGCAVKFYPDHPEAWVYDSLDGHKLLIEQLMSEYPDGWAYSLTSTTLQAILPLCPTDVRVAAWVKPFHIFKKGVRPAYAWEPVIWRGGRNPQWGHKHPPPAKGGKQTTPRDFISENITLKKGLTGAKPLAFCAWILDLFNMQPGDRLDDLFPGTDIMAQAIAQRFSP